ncbi:hypothetical protein ACN28S_03350 [Cystobacter fuscus]
MAFVSYMAERLTEEGDLEEALSCVQVHDLLLAFACLSGDGAAQRELSHRLDVEVRAALRGMGAELELVDEVKSVLGHRLLVGEEEAPKLAAYTGLGPLAAGSGWPR